MELKGKTAIVTGASGKLGPYIVRALAGAGCRCVCHYRGNIGAAERVAAEVRAGGGEAVAIAADLGDPAEMERFFDEAGDFGISQVLVNSAAVFERRGLADVTGESFERVLGINLVAPVLLCQMFSQVAEAAFGKEAGVIGKIVNIADVGGIRPWAGYVEYCSAKAGLIGATMGLAKELSPRFCVNAVAPGVVAWGDGIDEQEKVKQIEKIPLGRAGTGEEMAEAVMFLLRNDYVTGQVLKVDGGRSL